MDAMESKAAAIAKALVEIPSPSMQERQIAEWIAGYLKELGTGEVLIDEYGNLVYELDSGRPGRNLLFLTHTDTGPVELEDGRVRCSIEDGSRWNKKGACVCGIGSAAPKSSIAAMLLACSHLASERLPAGGTVKFAFVVRDLLANHDGPRLSSPLISNGDFAVSGEPTGNRIVLATRGILQLAVVFRGRKQHWGAPVPGENPFYGLAAFLRRLQNEPVCQSEVFGTTAFNPIDVATAFRPPLVAEEVRLFLDRRVLPGEDPAYFRNLVGRMAADVCGAFTELEAKVEDKSLMYPFKADTRSEEFRLFAKVVSDTLGDDAPTEGVRFATNAAFLTAALGIPSLVFGPGRIEDVGPDEHVCVKEIATAAQVYAKFAASFGER